MRDELGFGGDRGCEEPSSDPCPPYIYHMYDTPVYGWLTCFYGIVIFHQTHGLQLRVLTPSLMGNLAVINIVVGFMTF